MKVKVLEAIASGVPVVTTPSGAEGIAAQSGVVVDTDPERMALAAASILRDEGERRERGAEARGAFERLYTPGPATAPIAALYARMS
jgi:glycosyltransferase involved in cell wall biosynthesis